MRDWDLEVYVALLYRPGLYLGTNDLNGVEQFIRAYEMGSKCKCNFMNLLTTQLEDKYNVSMPGNGLIEQLKIISKNLNQNWEELFVKESEELLINESDKNNENRFQKILRSKILTYLKKKPEVIDLAWFMNLNQIKRQIDDWKGNSLSTEELKLFTELILELGNQISIQMMDKFPLKDKLKLNILELTKIIEKENKL